MTATLEIVPSVLDRIRRTLVGLKMPRALEDLDQTERQLERWPASTSRSSPHSTGTEFWRSRSWTLSMATR